jgi:hypothetical protein
MRRKITAGMAPILATAILTFSSTLPARAGASLAGVILGLDGRAGAGHTIHLVDPLGASRARTIADERGVYRFADVEPGEYDLGVETPAGEFAPVAAATIRLAEAELARRDVKLLATREGTAGSPISYGLGVWWAGLGPAAKAWTIVGLVVATGLTIAALDDSDDDDSEQDASPF